MRDYLMEVKARGSLSGMEPEPGIYEVAKIVDLDMLDFLQTLDRQKDEAIRKRPANAEKIREAHQKKVAKLLAWYEVDVVRWTKTDT
jgi:hypothetical protein